MNTILYYPYIKIEDGKWLRNAILYWDKIASIVPSIDYDEYHSSEVDFLEDQGMYIPVNPRIITDHPEIYNQFKNEIKNVFPPTTNRNKGLLTSRINIRNDYHFDREKNCVINIDKMPYEINQYLREAGYIGDASQGSYINLGSNASQMYMAIFAKYMAKVMQLEDGFAQNLVTTSSDEVKYYHLLSSIPEEANQKKEAQIFTPSDLSLNLILENVLPTPNMENKPLEDLIDFKKKNSDALASFKDEINQMKLKLITSDTDLWEEILHDYKFRIKHHCDEITDLMKQRNFSLSFRNLRSSIPLAFLLGNETLNNTLDVLPMPLKIVVNSTICIQSFLTGRKSSPVASVDNYNVLLSKGIGEEIYENR